MNDKILRTIDANTNRLTEGLRVCEDIARFILLDKVKTRKFKSLRHEAFSALSDFGSDGKILASFRDPGRDIGRQTIKNEKKRNGVADIFKANIKRAEESARVLEEFSKLANTQISGRFKNMRFKLYSLEKGVVKKLQSLCEHR